MPTFALFILFIEPEITMNNVPLNSLHCAFFGMSIIIIRVFQALLASLVAQMVKNLPAVEKTQVRSLGQDDALEKGMATHSSILAWRIPWTEEPGGLQSTRSQRVGHQ